MSIVDDPPVTGEFVKPRTTERRRASAGRLTAVENLYLLLVGVGWTAGGILVPKITPAVAGRGPPAKNQ
jgi:hypothetical protein